MKESESGTRCDGKAADLRCIGPLGLGKECGFYSESNEELLAGFKQGGVEWTDFSLLKIALVAVWRMNWRKVNVELGNQQGGHCYKPDKWWQGLELARWHWRWWEVGGWLWKTYCWLTGSGARVGMGERRERGLDMDLLALSLVLVISTLLSMSWKKTESMLLGFLSWERWLPWSMTHVRFKVSPASSVEPNKQDGI